MITDSNIDLHAPGVKDDKGKQLAGMVLSDFARGLTEVVKVGTYGAKKYSKGGWLHVEDAQERYKDAMMRHWLAMERGEEVDAESGLSHHAHCCWNCLALLDLKVRASEKK